MVQDAVRRRLETLADAAHRLSDELEARHPEIRWRAVYGFRNKAGGRARTGHSRQPAGGVAARSRPPGHPVLPAARLRTAGGPAGTPSVGPGKLARKRSTAPLRPAPGEPLRPTRFAQQLSPRRALRAEDHRG